MNLNQKQPVLIEFSRLMALADRFEVMSERMVGKPQQDALDAAQVARELADGLCAGSRLIASQDAVQALEGDRIELTGGWLRAGRRAGVPRASCKRGTGGKLPD